MILDPVPSGGIDRKRKNSPIKKTSQKRPSLSSLEQIYSTGSEDSGYASTQPEIGENILSPTTSLSVELTLETSMHDGKFESARSAHGFTQSGLRVDTWRLNPDPTKHNDSFALRPPSEVSPGAQPPSAVLEPSPVDWSQEQDGEPWWTDKRNDDGPDLISTARALEEQAQSLRLMATRQENNNDAHDMMVRRQTIAFPLQSPGEIEPRYDMLQNRTKCAYPKSSPTDRLNRARNF